MKKANEKSAASYLDTIGSGYESKTVVEGKPQIGKAHEEEVAKSNNWAGDKRDEIGRAASKKLARKLRRIAAELETFSEEYMEDEYAKDIDEVEEDMKDVVEDEAAMEVTGSCWAEIEKKLASHPLVSPNDKPEGEMDVRTGDEWIDVNIEDWKNDKRNEIGKPEPAKSQA